jgi:outer membrane protein OmpA-like peptidoglycan-associated protein
MTAMLKNTLLASAMTLSVYVLSTNAQAGHRPTEWYVGLEGGVNLVRDTNVLVTPPGPKIDAQFNTGWSVFLDAGYRWDNNWRLELEAGYRQNDVDCVTIGNAPCAGGSWGGISQATQMINVIHDIPLSDDTTLSLGLGLGADDIKVNSSFTQDNDWVFAGQVLLQLSHQITDRLELVATYRYLATDAPEFRVAGLQHASFDNENHTFSLGLRFHLQAAEEPMLTTPPPENLPPAPPEMPEQFVVFFGFNKSNLDAVARSVVAEAADTALHGGTASILVTGYTDTSGSSAYNDQLSLRRANAVKMALVDNGVKEQSISATGKGETVLLVQTKDQEKEPRNRRATIDIAHDDQADAEPAPPAAQTQMPAPPTEAPAKLSAPLPAPAPKPTKPALTMPEPPATPPAPAPVPTAAPAPSHHAAVDEDTLSQYHVWIAQARAKHPYTDSEQRMFDVMICESGGKASIVNPDGPHSGLFQYSTGTWKGEWNDYRSESILDAKAQIFATALAWQSGLQHQWGCYNHPH